MIRCFVGVFFFVLLGALIYAQTTPGLKKFTTENGLPGNIIYSVMQDSRGFLWISTGGGVSRYNGYEFESFDKKSGIPSGTVYFCYEDKAGKIWAIGDKPSVYYYEHDLFHPYAFNDSIRKAGIHYGPRSFVINNDSVFIGYDQTGCLVLDSSGNWKIIRSPSGLIVKELPFGTLQYFNGGERVGDDSIYFNGSAFPFYNEGIIFLIRPFITKNAKYVSTGRQLFTLKHDSLTLVRKEANITGLVEDDISRTWISYGMDGIRRFSNSREGLREEVHILRNINPIISLGRDMENGKWICSKGLYYLPSNPLADYSETLTNICNEATDDILLPGDASTYISFANGELWAVDKAKEPALYFKTVPLINQNQLLVYREKTGQLLTQPEIIAALERGLKKSDFDGKNFLDGDMKFIGKSSFVKAETAAGDVYWVAHFNALFRMENGNLTKVYTENDVVGYAKPIRDFRPGPMLLDGQGRQFYVVLELGLLELKQDKLHYLGHLNPLLRRGILDIRRYSRDTILIGSGEDGLIIWAGHNVFSISTDIGLSHKTVNTIAVDDDGFVWAGTNNGLNKIDIHAERPVLQVLTTLQGLPSNEITKIKIRGNELWIGTLKGVCVMDRRKIKPNTIVPNIEFTGLKVFETDTTLLPAYRFPYDQNYLTFSYTGIAFKHQGAMTYEYRLEGLEENWQNTSLRQVRYNSLAPGDYSFQVRAFNEDKIPSRLLALPFTVLPPYWQTWWFRLSSLSLLALVLALLFRWRINRLQEKAAYEKQLIRSELKALRAQMNPHFTFNTLNAIQRFILEKDAFSANDFLARFSRLMRRVLENSEHNWIPLETELDTLRMYLDIESLRFQDKLEYGINMSPDLVIAYLEVPPMLLQPYVENAILHGILHKREKGRIDIGVSEEDGCIKCVITDNGVGREKAREIENRSLDKDSSMGMKITGHQLELLQMDRQNKHRVEIMDLKDASGKASGTRVDIWVPYRKYDAEIKEDE